MTIPTPKRKYRIMIYERGEFRCLTEGSAVSGEQAIKEFKADNPEFRPYIMKNQEIKDEK